MIIKKVHVNAEYVRNQIKKAIVRDESISEKLENMRFDEDLYFSEFMSLDFEDELLFEGAIDMLESLDIIEYDKAVLHPAYDLHDIEIQEKPTKKQLQELLIELLEEQAKTNHYLRLLMAENKKNSGLKVVK